MSLSDDLASLPRQASGCGTCRWYSEQSDADRAEFDDCVKGKVSAASLHGVCLGHGLDVQISAFRTHLREHHGKSQS